MLKILFSFCCILGLNFVIFYYNLELDVAIIISICLNILIVLWLSKPNIDYSFRSKFLKLSSFLFLIFFSAILLVLFNNSLTIYLNIKFFDRFPVISDLDITLTNGMYFFLIAPLFEELIFRGKIQKKLENRVNHNVAIIICSILFTITHIFSNSGLIFIFVGSVFLGYIYYKYNNIYLVIIIHLLTNIASHYISKVDFLGSYDENADSFLIFSMIGVLLSLIGLIGLYHFRDKIFSLFIRITKEAFFDSN